VAAKSKGVALQVLLHSFWNFSAQPPGFAGRPG